jgi:hypothetical protein
VTELLYKVGDKVLVRNDLKIDECYGSISNNAHNTFVPAMEHLKGKIVTISHVASSGQYKIKEFCEGCNWVEEMFESMNITLTEYQKRLNE